MWPRIVLAFGIVVILLTLVAWWLLSGFGCEMNTSGCRTVRLELGRDALPVFLPPIALGVALMAIGFWKMPRPSGNG